MSKPYFSIYLEHKQFKDLNDLFVFKDINDFCYFAESFAMKSGWFISSNTNTKSNADYIKFLNTDVSRRYIDDDPERFENVSNIDLHYNKNKEAYSLSVLEYLKEIHNHFNYLTFKCDISAPHVMEFKNIGKTKEFQSYESILFFIKKLNRNNIKKNNISIKINYKSISFNEYINIIKEYTGDFNLPAGISSSEELNNFFIAIEDFNNITELCI